MKEDIKCEDPDKVKPVDKLLDDQISEFESGRDKECDKDLDTMIRELGDYENEEPKTEAGEFEEEGPIEEPPPRKAEGDIAQARDGPDLRKRSLDLPERREEEIPGFLVDGDRPDQRVYK